MKGVEGPAGAVGIRVEDLPERRVVVAPHPGRLATVDETRRPLYQYLIQHELVGGPSMLRFPEGPDGPVEVLVTAAPGAAPGDDFRLEALPGGPHAVLEYEGPESGVDGARRALLHWCQVQGRPPAGPLLQVHLMDAIDGVTEQEILVPLSS